MPSDAKKFPLLELSIPTTVSVLSLLAASFV
jgi:hypothetical protein